MTTALKSVTACLLAAATLGAAALPAATLAGPANAPAQIAQTKVAWKTLTPKQAATALKRLAGNGGGGSAGKSVYGECYPNDKESCGEFLAICDGAGGGASSLPGGGYGCEVRD